MYARYELYLYECCTTAVIKKGQQSQFSFSTLKCLPFFKNVAPYSLSKYKPEKKALGFK